MENARLIGQRKLEAEKNLGQAIRHLQEINVEFRTMDKDINTIRPQLMKLQRNKEDYTRCVCACICMYIMCVCMYVCRYACMCGWMHGYVYSGTPLIRTPEMWPPLYSGHFEKSQSMLFNTNSPLKCGHPSNRDTFTGPKGGRFRVYVYVGMYVYMYMYV